MSLDKAIEHGKEKRKKYYGAKEIDSTCRNHGTCGWCQHKIKRKEKIASDEFKEQLEEVEMLT
jgi:ferredoxin